MNSFVNAISKEILKGSSVSDGLIDIIASSIQNQPLNMKHPFRVIFQDGEEMDITLSVLRNWLRVYKSTPTTCKDKKEYEDKLLAMRI